MLFSLSFSNYDNEYNSLCYGAHKTLVVDAENEQLAKDKMKKLCRDESSKVKSNNACRCFNIHNEFRKTLSLEKTFSWGKFVREFETIYDLIDNVPLEQFDGYYTVQRVL